MKLHTKLILTLAAVLPVVITATQVYNFRELTHTFQALSDTDLKLLREREEISATNIFMLVENSVSGSLNRGEMEKFSRQLAEHSQLKGLEEFSLYSRAGAVTHSSDAKNVGKAMPTELKEQMTRAPGEFIKKSEAMVRGHETLEIYRPQLVTGDCVRCHAEWKTGEIGGVNYFRFSTRELLQAEAKTKQILAQAQRKMLWITVGCIALLMVVMVGLTWALMRRLVGRPLGLFVEMLGRFEAADGDLTRTIEIATRDEIGVLARLFNAFVANLNQVIGQAQRTALAVREDATAQAATVEETSSAVEEISAMTSQNAEHSRRANQLVRQVAGEVTRAGESLETLTTVMGELSAASGEVARVIKAIDGIAFQTNLLALNAAVEAARAGEAGRSFAVVAEEVRNLARRSAEAARGTGELLEDTLGKIARGETLTRESGALFQTMRGNCTEAASLVDQITEGSQQQSQGIAQVGIAMAELARRTSESAAQAEHLHGAMAAFKTDQ